MRATLHQAHCPACGKREHGPSEAALERHMDRHARSCGALKRAAAGVLKRLAMAKLAEAKGLDS